MARIQRIVTTDADPRRVHEYLADFTNATEWDHGTVSCELVSGDGGPGSVYRNISEFGGREVEVMYTVQDVTYPKVELVGRNGKTSLQDRIRIDEHGEGSSVTYDAELTSSGLLRLAAPIMGLLFKRLADKTEQTLAQALGRL